MPAIASLIREDWVYCDDEAWHVSCVKHPGYMSFSEKFRKHFGTDYAIDKIGACITGPTGKSVNMENVLSMLKSKDASLYDNMVKDDHFDGKFRFLDMTPLKTKVAFLSYPRSGNSLMRRVLEQSFGVATGSSGSLHTGTYLQINGMKGQHIVDDRCWIVKSHHPTRTPKVLQFNSDKVHCVVRNPLDVIVSFATLTQTMSHSAVLEFDISK